jgi:hypothetical protein
MALVINLRSRFSWHGGTYESNHFLKQWRRIVITKTPTSIGNKTTKVKKLREDGFWYFVFVLFGFCFVVGLFFYVFQSINQLHLGAH